METVGIVVIGRNEGDRLERALDTVLGRGNPVIYVDSASTDDSVKLARRRAIQVVELDRSRRLNAARARNAGFQRLRELDPGVGWVQFVDGDCELSEAWVETAAAVLREDPGLGIVCGILKERHAEASAFHRACQVEWDKPVGEVNACGGIFMASAKAFESVGGFDESLAAGEEPELCQRLQAGGWRIRRIAADMARHDAGPMRFRQWWTRQVRTGHSTLEVATRFGSGPKRLYMDIVRSARFWGLGWPLAVGLAAVGGGIVSGKVGAVLAAVSAAFAMPLQILRVSWGAKRKGHPPRVALSYGALTMLGKWPQLLGQYRYLKDRAAGRAACGTECKGLEPVKSPLELGSRQADRAP